MKPKLTFVVVCLAAAACLRAERVTLSLDGEWEIADSEAAGPMPASFNRKAPVPGLANLANPSFEDVDLFDSREVISNRIRRGLLPPSAAVKNAGVSRQKRNYFWYRRSFQAPARKQVAILKINKAQFGTAVWLNGKPAGENLSCFTAGYFNVTESINWAGENRLAIRVGAHPGVLPEWIPAGTDFEKNKWTPGIYDSVSLLASDNPVVESVQVAPRIGTSEIVVETKVKNYSASDAAVQLRQRVKEWRGGARTAETRPEKGVLKPGEERTFTQTIPIPKARLWSPEDPFLYALETSTGGDDATTRFGMREFRFDTATRRAYLNGKVYFLRGSNITLHRFFEDPHCRNLPWREDWVRKLLGEIPKRMHWNTFRFCIGPAPERWFEIADEVGLLIQNEYFMWTGHPSWAGGYERSWKSDALIREYAAWMRDHWNHPSVAIWDANNESYDPIYADEVIPAVRKLDLSNRPWENSYNAPAGPDDPVEDHPYLFSRTGFGGKPFRMTELESMRTRESGSNTPSAHAVINNEYGWIWLNRDGTPTELTGKVYEDLLGAHATPEQRLALNGYLLGGLTEFWRAFRNYAGVLHFVYLTSSYPGAYTSDHFRDIETLELDPAFSDYVGEAFKPLAVYISFWQPSLAAGSEREFAVMMVNDEHKDAEGRLTLAFESAGGAEAVRAEKRFAIPANGAETYLLRLRTPDAEGDYLLKATAVGGGRQTLSRRKVTVKRGE
ncbi:MAG: hypothetical protein KIT09_23460 [Bryobacteraceae bacterium]|nr:hypothetical protein [Bryobacteraceae bacterium]